MSSDEGTLLSSLKGEINNVTEDNRNTEQTYAWYSDESDIRMSDLNCIH